MVSLVAQDIRKDALTRQVRIVLKCPENGHTLAICLSDHEARVLALELEGLAAHRYPQHQMTVAVADALDAVISGVLLHAHTDRYMDASLRLARMGGLIDVPVNLVAALAIAIHLGLPVFYEDESCAAASCTDGEEEMGKNWSRPGVPPAFWEALDGLQEE